MKNKLKTHPKITAYPHGFALISTIIVVSLLSLVALGMLSISSVEVNASQQEKGKEEARANAQLALIQAISALQEAAGPDQRVTARASILEDPDKNDLIANRNWLGVWNTTFESNERDWPIIGKAPDLNKTIEPYEFKGIYSDLRYTNAALNSDKWKETLHRTWLVSSKNQDVNAVLDPNADHVLEILGRGTLGQQNKNYLQDRVLVEKIEVNTDRKKGAYAWFISDNSQKASLLAKKAKSQDQRKALAAASSDNPSGIVLDSKKPYANYISDADGDLAKIISRNSAALVAENTNGVNDLKRAIGSHFHHFTTNSTGLFTDSVLGGFKKDLTPLLLGEPNRSSALVFDAPNTELASYPFSSRYPIIPGQRKATLGPSFAALREWGKLKYKSTSSIAAEQTVTADAKFNRPTQYWDYGISDGLSVDASEWAEKGPKIKPVMVDCRYHYYFSYTGTGVNKKFRTHLIPRVCLWNPYNVELKMDNLSVLMANPFGAPNYSKRFHFYFTQQEVNRIKAQYSDPSHAKHVIHNWTGRIYVNGNKGLFPSDRYLGFMLASSTLQPGECLVFSPAPSTPSDETAQGVNVQRYDATNIGNNLLSAASPQGEDHFIHEKASNTDIKMETGKRKEAAIAPDVWNKFKLSEIHKYEVWAYITDPFTFVLKEGKNLSSSAKNANSQNSTLQLFTCGNGGIRTYGFWFYSSYWGNSGTQFGRLETFQNAPRKSPPRLHQIGYKLLWLDESSTEGNDRDPIPLRLSSWNGNSLAYNPAVIANWNVRPSYINRSPSSPLGGAGGRDTWYSVGSGAWLLQFAPKTPQDFNDMPSINADGTYFVKPPLTLSTQSGVPLNMVLFDLPDADYGVLSLAKLRHAQLSPYSWHPTYIIGNSLADFHAPYDSSAEPSLFEKMNTDTKVTNTWDLAIGGGNNGNPFSWGARVNAISSDNLLQIGNSKASVSVNGQTLDSKDEHLSYDIVFEVNQNLWDQYFISGMPLDTTGSNFNWKTDGSISLNNLRFGYSQEAQFDPQDMQGLLDADIGNGFWLNGYLLQNNSAFNVNSTSIEAWTAFLSAIRGIDRGKEVAGENSLFSRFREPLGSAETSDVAVDSNKGWEGGRRLTDSEIVSLATNIVSEVKRRGPFLSMADFVNRRLAPKNEPVSKQGALEQAIVNSGLNAGFNHGVFAVTKSSQTDRNHPKMKPDVDKQPASKAWGIPGYLTQSDILEPLAPAMTVRGDTFVIRAYGESRDKAGKILATAYLEATVQRTAEYVEPASATVSSLDGKTNRATDPALTIDRVSGAIYSGNLTPVNKRFGRKFVIKSIRWMNPNEI